MLVDALQSFHHKGLFPQLREEKGFNKHGECFLVIDSQCFIKLFFVKVVSKIGDVSASLVSNVGHEEVKVDSQGLPYIDFKLFIGSVIGKWREISAGPVCL